MEKRAYATRWIIKRASRDATRYRGGLKNKEKVVVNRKPDITQFVCYRRAFPPPPPPPRARSHAAAPDLINN